MKTLFSEYYKRDVHYVKIGHVDVVNFKSAKDYCDWSETYHPSKYFTSWMPVAENPKDSKFDVYVPAEKDNKDLPIAHSEKSIDKWKKVLSKHCSK